MARKKKIETEEVTKAKTPRKPRATKVKENIPEVIVVKEKHVAEPRKKTLLDFQQTDGKIYNKKGVKSLDELMGETRSRYHTHEYTEYERYLNTLNTSDLQTHAATLSVMPNQDRHVLTKRLLQAFRVYNSAYLNTADIVSPIQKTMSEETIKILSEGR